MGRKTWSVRYGGMVLTFDINNRKVIDPDSGEYDEEEVERYQDELIELFEQSAEAQELVDEGLELGHVYPFLSYGGEHLGVAPPSMDAATVESVVFDLFPRKVTVMPEEASAIVQELRAFWRFLLREFALPNAAECLGVLEEATAVERLRKKLSDPSSYDMAKSMMMLGIQRGFDVTTEDGLNEWMRTYQAEQMAAAGGGMMSPSMGGYPSMMEDGPVVGGQKGGAKNKAKKKAKRKQAKASRKANRKK